MLQNPDNPYEEWEETVKANTLDAARSLCEQLIKDNPLTELMNVTQITRTADRSGKYKFVCWFRSEVQNDDNSN
jgi:hypothetical protein